MREFQTQLLHYFSKSDNKSNHHQICSNSHFGAAALSAPMRLLCYSFVSAKSSFTSRNPSSLSVDRFKNVHDLQSFLDCDHIRSPSSETIYEERHWMKVVQCLLTFFDWYCHLNFDLILLLFHLKKQSSSFAGNFMCSKLLFRFVFFKFVSYAAFSARSSLLQILRNSSCRHSVLFLLSLSSVTNLSLIFGLCAACMLSYRCLQMDWWAAISVVAIPSQHALLI